MLTRANLVQLLFAGLATAGLATACTTLLGDDFEIGPAGSGAQSQGGDGASSSGGGSGAGGNIGGNTNTGAGGGGGQDLCGNGEPDPGELCDGDCPDDCIDADLCSSDTLEGSAADCDAICAFDPVVTCIDNDGCCPNGCYDSIDNDCFLRVLIVSTDANGAPAIQSALEGFPILGTVDLFDAAAAIPTMDSLMAYGAVLLFADYQGFPDPVAIGNLLADFHDQGGRVVVANGANCQNYQLQGRFVDDGYLALGIGAINPGDDSIGTIEVPNTPLLDQVGNLDVVGHCNGAATPGSTVVARYAVSDDPIVAYRWVGERRRVDLNVFPSQASVVADLVLNALLFQ